MTKPTKQRDEALAIEDYALIGDCSSAALVGRNGSIDWLCLPRFDSPALFASLLGSSKNGRYRIAPTGKHEPATRRYRDDSMVLETLFTTETGEVALIDFMLPGADNSSIVRIVEGRHGSVDMRMDLCIRFDYGLTVPWVTRRPGGNGLVAIAGPEMLVLRTPVKLEGHHMETTADFTVKAGERLPFVLTHGPSNKSLPMSPDPDDALYDTEHFWSDWAARCKYKGPYERDVRRSLMVLKALTYTATGGIVAAPTASLPEVLGGERNWDYRFCWLRDAVITLFAFMGAGYHDEAASWARWLHRSVAGDPAQLQIMYGLAGERRLEEAEIPWLDGYQGAKPVRTGNAAAGQLQLDVYGEVMSALWQARDAGLLDNTDAWSVQKAMLEHLETIWDQPDEGLWETRGGRKHFTFSKIMAWIAFDRGIRDSENHGLEAPVERWKQVRDEIHEAVCSKGFSKRLNSFTQSFGADALDASLLLIVTTDFLPLDDPRVVGTVDAIEKGLMSKGFVLRYRADEAPDGLEGEEGAFLACSFWLATAMHMLGRQDDARNLFDRLVELCNDVGLLSEEYDPHSKRLVGNFPQAFSHVALVTTAMRLSGNPNPGSTPGQAGSSVS
ncbi:MAG: glycoside hydrolase family 15 protein [Janthinobacterium lividum]